MDKLFWEGVDLANECLVWLGRLDRDGYAMYGRRNAHRYAYEQIIGPIAEKMQIDHLCRVRHCVNPEHMEQVTGKENTLRGNTITARNKAVTHCPAGHEYDAANTHISRGKRNCRLCGNAAARRYYQRMKHKARLGQSADGEASDG